MKKFHIDINCDLGEGFGNDHLIMPYISSCNIACGGHAGDAQSMRHTLQRASEYGVRAGAHPSFPDRENFGRQMMNMDPVQLSQTIIEQTEALLNIAEEEGIEIHHLKPHGALYNLAVQDETTAASIVEALRQLPSDLILYAPSGSVLATMARKEGFTVWNEAFLDRNYNEDMTLVSRNLPEATVNDVRQIAEQVRLMVTTGQLRTLLKTRLPVQVDTLCIHGDNPMAPTILKQLHPLLMDLNIEVR